MKRLLVLLVLLAGGVVAAAFAIPTNAAVVNGATISQQSLNGDVSAIAGSQYYQCYLNSQAYLGSNGQQQQLPPVAGAGPGQSAGDNPTAGSAFTAGYLSTKIQQQLVLNLAATRGVTVSQAQLDDARTSFTGHITSVMSQVLQTAQGGNPRYSCSVTGRPISGTQVLDSLPASFVDGQVQYIATVTALQEVTAGVGASDADLRAFYDKHRAEFDIGCFNAAAYSSQAAAAAAAAAVAYGQPFSAVAANATQSGTIPCAPLAEVAAELGTSVATLEGLTVGKVSDPLDVQGNFVIVEMSSRTPSPYLQAKPVVSQVVQQQGANLTQAAITAAERHATVSVDPRYGTWVPASASVFTPFVPVPTDVLNAPANQPGLPVSASTSPFSG